jgi:multidrug efflux pump subunit AcrB
MGAILAGTAAAYGVLGQGLEFFPETEPRQIWVDLETPSGTNLDTSDGIVRGLETATSGMADILTAIANVGSTGVSVDPSGGGGAVGTSSRLTLDLADHKDRTQNSLSTLEGIRAAVQLASGGDVKVDRPQEGPPTGKAISLRIMGEDFADLGRLSASIQEGIRSIPGVVNLDDDFDEGKPEIRIRVNRVQAALAGVNTREIATTVQAAIRGAEASKFRIGEDEYDIRVRLSPSHRASMDELGNLTVPDEDGRPIPMRTIARLETGVGPAAVRRVDLKRVVSIEGDVVRAPGRTEDSVRAEIATYLESVTFPPGYRWEFSGSNDEERDSQSFLQRAFVFAVLLIVLVLVTQFNSLILPATVMVSVVLSLIGVLWGLILTHTAFGIIMTGIGVISLAGIVVNNAIVLCDFIVQLREQGRTKTAAVIEAGLLRFRPVMLTAVTTVLGLLPLTLGLNVDFFAWTVEYGADSSQWWGPMGVAVISGLTVATILTLVVVPVTYHTLDDFSSLLASLPSHIRDRRRAMMPGAEPAGALSRRERLTTGMERG